MKSKIISLYLVCTFFLASCGGVTPYPTPLTASPTLASASTSTSTPQIPTQTNTPTLTSTPQNTPTPEILSGYPTLQSAVLPTCSPGGCIEMEDNVQRQDLTFHDLYLGKYVLRRWCNVDPNIRLYSYCAVTISSKDKPQVEIWGWPAKFREETGADLTGDGMPDIVITNWGGGNCCVSTIIYKTGDTLEKVLDIGNFRPGTFVDLDENGTYEYITLDRLWSTFCNCTVYPSVIFEYQAQSGEYLPATDKFKNTYLDFHDGFNFLDEFRAKNPNAPFLFLSADRYSNPTVEDEEYFKLEREIPDYHRAICTLYNIMVSYMLAGEEAEAQKTLNKYLPPDKANEYMIAIKKDLKYYLPP
jgi:hypothetical protein